MCLPVSLTPSSHTCNPWPDWSNKCHVVINPWGAQQLVSQPLNTSLIISHVWRHVRVSSGCAWETRLFHSAVLKARLQWHYVPVWLFIHECLARHRLWHYQGVLQCLRLADTFLLPITIPQHLHCHLTFSYAISRNSFLLGKAHCCWEYKAFPSGNKTEDLIRTEVKVMTNLKPLHN